MMSTKKQKQNLLSGKQKQYLRGLGHHLNQGVLVGREGLSDNLVQSTIDALQAHELIKVKLGQNCPLGKKEAAQQLADKTRSVLVQLIGKTILLYRPNKNLAENRRIQLP